MNNETKIGVVLGLNIAVERLFKKIWDVMHVEAMCKHDMLPALSDDMETITDLIDTQRIYIEQIGVDPLKKDEEDAQFKADLQALESKKDHASE